jgi:CubicO group peptidase (beta-lactamase class C family)
MTAMRGRGLVSGEREGGMRVQIAIGHAGVGGSIGLCVPEKRVAVAVTISKLSGERTATRRLLDLLLGEVGLAAPAGI